MSRGKSIASFGLLFLSLGIATRAALGDDNKNQAAWDKLKQLSAGQEIQVVQNDAKSSRGNFRSATDEAIVVSTATGEQTISRQSVLRVSTNGKGHRRRNVLIGAGIGAGVAAGAVGASVKGQACWGSLCPGEAIGAFAVLGAAGGAIVGAVLPTGGWHEIYRAR